MGVIIGEKPTNQVSDGALCASFQLLQSFRHITLEIPVDLSWCESGDVLCEHTLVVYVCKWRMQFTYNLLDYYGLLGARKVLGDDRLDVGWPRLLLLLGVF